VEQWNVDRYSGSQPGHCVARRLGLLPFYFSTATEYAAWIMHNSSSSSQQPCHPHTDVKVIVALPQVPPLVHLAYHVAAAVLQGQEGWSSRGVKRMQCGMLQQQQTKWAGRQGMAVAASGVSLARPQGMAPAALHPPPFAAAQNYRGCMASGWSLAPTG